MSPSVLKIWRVSVVWTIFFALLCMIVCLFLPFESPLRLAAGVALGALLGLAGLRMICSMASGMTADPKALKRKGTLGYAARYSLYAVVLFSGAFAGLSVLSMLAGFLCSKAALLVYAMRSRKENE